MRGDEATPQMQVENIQHSSFLFKKHDDLDRSDVTVLQENKYLVNDMVIQDWHLVRRVHNPDDVDFTVHIRSPFRIGKFDFVIVGSVKGWHLVNVDDGTNQLLVKCHGLQGFCITTEDSKAFDFHFTCSGLIYLDFWDILP